MGGKIVFIPGAQGNYFSALSEKTAIMSRAIFSGNGNSSDWPYDARLDSAWFRERGLLFSVVYERNFSFSLHSGS